MADLKVAIIGIGAIAGVHAQALSAQRGVELVAAVGRSRARGEAFAGRWGCRWFDDYRRMLDDVRPDAVTVCTPSGAHLEPALAAIERGVHVLCEKPLEISLERIDRMIEAAERAGVTLGGVFPQRYNLAVRAVHAAAAAGRFGRLAAVSVSVPWWRDDAYYAPHRWQGKLALDGGGALINQAIHSVDLLQWLATAAADAEARAAGVERVDGSAVTEVFCFADKLAHDPAVLEVEDTAVAVCRLSTGGLGQIQAATSMYPGSLRRVGVAGRDGSAEVLEEQLVDYRFRHARPEDDRVREDLALVTGHPGGSTDPLAIPVGHHARCFCDFFEAIRAGRSPTVDGREARKAVALIEACYRSARTGRPAAVDGGTVGRSTHRVLRADSGFYSGVRG